MSEKHPRELTLDEIEGIEKLTLRWIYQAVTDFGMEAHEVFLKSPDSVKGGHRPPVFWPLFFDMKSF
ncbi:MAG: hypothetical protein B6245_16455 [Desulfobacteraceae bacterium 4572_88]|nr:MAG: hypothetical protein B6245_16455 [Desulfobacteraceae bacterium 4572_88]